MCFQLKQLYEYVRIYADAFNLHGNIYATIPFNRYPLHNLVKFYTHTYVHAYIRTSIHTYMHTYVNAYILNFGVTPLLYSGLLIMTE